MYVNSRLKATKIIGQTKYSIGREFQSLAVEGNCWHKDPCNI